MAATVEYISICVSYHCENIVEGDLERSQGSPRVRQERLTSVEKRVDQGTESRLILGKENGGSLKSTVEVHPGVEVEFTPRVEVSPQSRGSVDLRIEV